VPATISLSIVLGYRNRETERLARLLDSLADQNRHDLEVLLVDYGSEPPFQEKARRLAAEHSFCQYVFSESRGLPWNRSQALNIGGRRAKGDFVLFTDADMLFPPRFVDHVLARAAENRVLYCYPHMLPRDFEDFANLGAYVENFPTPGQTAKGGCQCLSTKLFRQIRGFDEYYHYHGVEDRDLWYRCNSMGMQEEWLNGRVEIFHQWHPTWSYNTPGHLPDGLLARFEDHFHRMGKELVRNSDDWGHIHTSEDRPVYRLLDFEKQALHLSGDLQLKCWKPNSNLSSQRLVRAFHELPVDHCLAVDYAFFPKRNQILGQTISLLNKGLHRFSPALDLDFSPNLLHAALAEMIEHNKKKVADLYLAFSCREGVS